MCQFIAAIIGSSSYTSSSHHHILLDHRWNLVCHPCYNDSDENNNSGDDGYHDCNSDDTDGKRDLHVNTDRQRQFTWYCSDLHHLLLLVTSLIEPPPGKSAASPPSPFLETDRRACSEDDDDDDALTSLKQVMESMLNATMSCSSSRSDGRGRGGWE